MVDIAGDSSTTSSIAVGGTVSGTLEVVGDHDWYRIQLTAGQQITVALNGTLPTDTFLNIRDSAGNVLFSNDDINAGNTNSLISFAATTTGTYYIDAGGYNDQETGNYQISVTNFVQPSVGTVDQFAFQLTNGYWGGQSRHFNVAPGGSITVNVAGLSTAGQNLAHQALGTWSDIIGVNFVDVTSGGQIVFTNTAAGAATDSTTTGSFITQSNVNVSSQWLIDYGTATNTYSFQAFIHEIGHALGLGHAGNYNDTARYPFDALYSNDAWPLSVMSYFDETESTYWSGRGFTREYVTTPMLADIVAVGNLYGLSTTTRTGDTVYGFNSTAGRAQFDATQFTNVAYTIIDNGGIDTLDYSGFGQNQRIDLNQEAYSNIGSKIGNVSIARGTVIENAIGGSGVDTIIGNSTANVITGRAGGDTLTGGAGADTFSDTAANMNGDTITDFTAQDKIVITDANAASFSFTLNGSTLSFGGSSITLTGFSGTNLVASAAAGGGVQLVVQGSTQLVHAENDFNGDGRSDVLWRNDAGTIGTWSGTAAGGFTINGALTPVSNAWHIAGSGDFNGDGRSDVLWRNDDGSFGTWLGQANGSLVYNSAAGIASVSNNWHIVGTGDFNGDGRDDILWRSDSGGFGNWLATANGGFSVNSPSIATVDTSWKVAGTADINGDGRDDIVWRSDSGGFGTWLANANGSFTVVNASVTTVATSWHVVGTGDFNGDGREDVLWRNDNGGFGDWLGQADGTLAYNPAAGVTSVATNWHIAGTVDANGDGRTDILWISDSGQFGDWLANANGSFSVNSASITNVPTDWHVQSPEIFWV